MDKLYDFYFIFLKAKKLFNCLENDGHYLVSESTIMMVPIIIKIIQTSFNSIHWFFLLL